MRICGAEHMTSNADPLRVRVYRNLGELEKLAPAWETLLSVYPLATTFCTWEWLSAWWRAFGGDRELLVLGFFAGNSELVGLAPLSLERHPLGAGPSLRLMRLMGDGSGDSDDLDLPVRPGWEQPVTRTLLQFLRTQAPPWDVCAFNLMNPESPLVKGLLGDLQTARWPVFRSALPWSVICMPETWESYLKILSPKERGKLGTRTRRLEKRYKVNFRKCAQETELPKDLETLFDLHGKRWRVRGEPGSFVSAQRRTFYQDVALSLLKRGWLEFWFLEVDGKEVATLFGFRYGSTVFSLQEGYDPAFASDSVGYILRGHVLKHLISAGVRRYDFLAGKDESKERWSALVGHYINLHFAKPFSVGSIYLHSVHGARTSKEWLRERLPQPAWGALHRLNLMLRSRKTNSTPPVLPPASPLENSRARDGADKATLEKRGNPGPQVRHVDK
jgi:CelD/BcsL family acetyltransferase involved in cellulose biosynthesis